jgi:hypothetical protein
VPNFCALWRAFNAVAGDRWRKVVVAPLAHRTCPVNYSEANSRSWRVPEALFLGAPDTVRCTPDSPVNYSGAPLDFPEGDEFDLESLGAPDTVRCARPGLPSVIPLLSLLNPILGLLLAKCEPLAPVKLIH